MRKFKFILGLALPAAILLLTVHSCRKIKPNGGKPVLELPSALYNYSMVKDEGNLVDVKIKIKDESRSSFTNATATLGRVLFYDRNLSINGNISCGSCHDQSKAFSDGLAGSPGFANQSTPRNSMAILNVADNNNMFWDSRSKSPLDLALQPVFNHLEMGMETEEMLVAKLKTIDYYKPLFQDAFNSEEIDQKRISLALSNFLSALYSKDSKFDREKKNNFAGFTSLERMGKNLFESNRMLCSSCHSTQNFSAPDHPGGAYGGGGGMGHGFPTHSSVSPGQDFTNPSDPKGTANIGLETTYKDNGFGQGQFKIPSLRNIELTGPYMHDGRFETLSDVIDHYSHGIKNHPNLDPKLRFNGQARKLNITEHEKVAIIAFLKTLTDDNLLNDPKFSDPFVLK